MSSVPARPRPRRRWSRWLFVAFLVLVVGAVYRWQAGKADVARAEADAAAVDPALTLSQVEASREVVPDEENGALRVLAAAAKLTPSKVDLVTKPLKLSPPHRLDPVLVGGLCEETAANADALAEARRLEGLPRGRFPLVWASPVMTTNLSHAQSLRSVHTLLVQDALLHTEAGDLTAAVRAVRAALNADQALGDEPLLISQLVRVACRGRTISVLERVIAQGEPPAGELAGLQEAFADDRADVNMAAAFRGERALAHATLRDISEGKLSFAALSGAGAAPSGWADELKERAGMAWAITQLDSADVWLLRYQTEQLVVLRGPAERWKEAFSQKAAVAGAPPLAQLLVGAIDKCILAAVRNKARVRCAVVLLALERHRQATGRWPTTLDALAPAFLAAVPLDPYDGKPLRYRPTADGVLVYSVGPDGVDDGGNLDRQWVGPAGTDVGLQMWDVGRRRQPPSEPAGNEPK